MDAVDRAAGLVGKQRSEWVRMALVSELRRGNVDIPEAMAHGPSRKGKGGPKRVNYSPVAIALAHADEIEDKLRAAGKLAPSAGARLRSGRTRPGKGGRAGGASGGESGSGSGGKS